MAEEKRMTNEEFLTVQQQLTLFAGAVMVLDVESYIERCERADALGPILDPTLYIKGNERLSALKELAEGALKFKQAALRFRNTMTRLDSAASLRAAKEDPGSGG